MKNHKTPALTLRQLRHFVAVAHASSMTSAASELAITQPALTESIRLIEGRLECQLFDRSSRRLSLTPTGEAILPMAERVLHVSNNTLDDMYAVVGRRLRTLHVGTVPALASRVYEALAHIKEAMPEVIFEVDDLSHQALLEETLNGKLDLAVGIRDTSGHELSHSDYLFNDDIVLVAHAQSELAALSSVSWAMLKEHPLAVLRSSDMGGILKEVGQASGFFLTPAYQTRFIESLSELLRRQYAVAILPRIHAEFIAGPDLVIRPLAGPSASIEVVLYSLDQHPHVPIFIECRQRLIDQLKE